MISGNELYVHNFDSTYTSTVGLALFTRWRKK